MGTATTDGGAPAAAEALERKSRHLDIPQCMSGSKLRHVVLHGTQEVRRCKGSRSNVPEGPEGGERGLQSQQNQTA